MDGPDFGELRETLDEHAPALQRYALLVTGDTARAADVVGETMLRARRDPQLVGAPAPSVRASLFRANPDRMTVSVLVVQGANGRRAVTRNGVGATVTRRR